MSIYPILTEQTGIEEASRPGNEESEKKSVEKLNSRLYDDWWRLSSCRSFDYFFIKLAFFFYSAYKVLLHWQQTLLRITAIVLRKPWPLDAPSFKNFRSEKNPSKQIGIIAESPVKENSLTNSHYFLNEKPKNNRFLGWDYLSAREKKKKLDWNSKQFFPPKGIRDCTICLYLDDDRKFSKLFEEFIRVRLDSLWRNNFYPINSESNSLLSSPHDILA